MKNPFTQFAFVIFAFIALTFLMAYVKPAADEPKEYIVVSGNTNKQLEERVNQKMAEGWRCQGGYGANFFQAMVK
jgi:hypothetical protein